MTIAKLIVGGLGAVIVLQYFFIGIHYKKCGKKKEEISQELIELLKE